MVASNLEESNLLRDEIRNLIHLHDVKWYCARLLLPMPVDEFLELLLSPPDSDDGGAFGHEAVGERFADAGRGADDEDTLVLEGHLRGRAETCDLDGEGACGGGSGVI